MSRTVLLTQWFWYCWLCCALRCPISKREAWFGQHRQAPHTLTDRSKTASESELGKNGRVGEPSPCQMSRWIHSFITPLFSSLAQMANVSKPDCESAHTATG